MKSNLGKFVALALGLGLATETFAEEWNVSTWGKRRAFTEHIEKLAELVSACLLYTSPSPRDLSTSRMPSSA